MSNPLYPAVREHKLRLRIALENGKPVCRVFDGPSQKLAIRIDSGILAGYAVINGVIGDWDDWSNAHNQFLTCGMTPYAAENALKTILWGLDFSRRAPALECAA